jgi:hypothetical protein
MSTLAAILKRLDVLEAKLAPPAVTDDRSIADVRRIGAFEPA